MPFLITLLMTIICTLKFFPGIPCECAGSNRKLNTAFLCSQACFRLCPRHMVTGPLLLLAGWHVSTAHECNHGWQHLSGRLPTKHFLTERRYMQFSCFQQILWVLSWHTPLTTVFAHASHSYGCYYISILYGIIGRQGLNLWHVSSVFKTLEDMGIQEILSR